MEGITSRDKIDFSVMTEGEIFWYIEGKKQGHKEAKEDYEESARERYEDDLPVTICPLNKDLEDEE